MYIDHENKKLNSVAKKFLMKYLTMNQNVYKSKLPLFHVFRGSHEFNFLKKYICVNKTTLVIFYMFTKFNYLTGTNILQIVFDVITHSIVICFYFVSPTELLACPE